MTQHTDDLDPAFCRVARAIYIGVILMLVLFACFVAMGGGR